MKKLLFVLVLVMSVMVVNAQTKTTPSSTEKKTTTTTTTTTKAPAATLKVSDLPKAVTDNIEKAYPGYTIKEVKSEKNGAEYKVMIEKGTSKESLLYDKEGKLIKSSAKSTTTETKETKK